MAQHRRKRRGTGRLDGDAVDTVATVPGGFLLGIALDADRNVYACDPNSGYVMRISPEGEVQRHGERVGYPNYPVFDGDGNLWVTDSGAWDEVTGGLVRIAPDGATERVGVPALRFANGCAIGGNHLYLVESQMPGVVRMPLAGGELEPAPCPATDTLVLGLHERARTDQAHLAAEHVPQLG